MAEFVFAALTANGTAIEESPDVTTVHDMGGEDTSKCIEILEMSYGVSTPLEGATGVHARGARQQKPIEFTFRLGGVGPVLQQALTMNEEIEGTFKFFRQNAQSGATEHFYTVTVAGARLCDITTESPNCLNPETASLPPLMHAKLVAHTTTYSADIEGKEYQDMWSTRA